MGGTSIRSSKHGRDQTIGTSRLFTISGVTMREGQGVLATPHPTRLEASVASVAARRSVPLKGVWPQVGGDQRESKDTVHSRGATTAAADSRPDRGLITPIIDLGRVTVGGCVLGVRAPTADDNDTCAKAVCSRNRARPVAFRAVRDPAIRHADVSAHSMPIHRDIA